MNCPAFGLSKATATAIAVSLLLFEAQAASARLVVVDDQKGKTINKLECQNGCTVDLKFDIVSTGFDIDGKKDPAIYTVKSYSEENLEFLNLGDVKYDIVAEGKLSQGCNKIILPGNPCTVTATFKVVDNDPSDDFQIDRKAKQNGADSNWDEALVVEYASTADRVKHFADRDHYIGVLDVVPEPSSWVLMLLGFGAVGAGLRRRRFGTRAPA